MRVCGEHQQDVSGVWNGEDDGASGVGAGRGGVGDQRARQAGGLSRRGEAEITDPRRCITEV